MKEVFYLSKEEKIICFSLKDGTQSHGILELYDEAPDDEEMVLIRTTIGEQKLSFKEENYFEALKQLREHLEESQIQIQCNGAALNVYPSPMALSMGTGRLAYRLIHGKQAKTIDLVDIFDCNNDQSFVSIDEQANFYKDWLKSLS